MPKDDCERAQSALEFMTAYAWAFVVIILVVVVLYYIGALNAKNVQANTCAFAPGFSCYGFGITNGTGELILDLGQATGDTLRITNISCTQSRNMTLLPLNNSITIPPGDHRFIVGNRSGNAINCTDEYGEELTPQASQFGERYKGNVCLAYTELSSGRERIICGEVMGKFSFTEPVYIGTPTPMPTLTITPVQSATPTPTPTPAPLCDRDAICGGNETCSCIDCEGQQSICGEGLVCSEGDCMVAPTPTPTPTPIIDMTPQPTPVSQAIAECPTTISVLGEYYLEGNLAPEANSCITFDAAASGSTLDCMHYSISSSGDAGLAGINLEHAANITILNCNIRNFNYGIQLNNGVGNTITNNTLSSNTVKAIYLISSHNNTISRNALTSNTCGGGCNAIYLFMSDGNSISGNALTGNNGGIYLKSSTNNSLTGNDASDNVDSGIIIESSTGNTFTNNTANANSAGIWLYQSNGNTFTGNTATGSRGTSDFVCDGSQENSGSGNSCGSSSCGWLACH